MIETLAWVSLKLPESIDIVELVSAGIGASDTSIVPKALHPYVSTAKIVVSRKDFIGLMLRCYEQRFGQVQIHVYS